MELKKKSHLSQKNIKILLSFKELLWPEQKIFTQEVDTTPKSIHMVEIFKRNITRMICKI